MAVRESFRQASVLLLENEASESQSSMNRERSSPWKGTGSAKNKHLVMLLPAIAYAARENVEEENFLHWEWNKSGIELCASVEEAHEAQELDGRPLRLICSFLVAIISGGP